MKVKIGKYTNFFGPHQLAEFICFWDVDPDIEHDTFRDHLGEFIASGNGGKNHKTWLYKLLLWIDKKKKRKISIELDKWDTWSMDHTLSLIIVPMLKQLKATTHGAPQVDLDDVPDNLKPTDKLLENTSSVDDLYFDRWNYVLDEMIFAFSAIADDDWKDQFYSGEHDTISSPNKDKDGNTVSYSLTKGPRDTFKVDYDGMKIYQNRINNGLRLFGKYYQGLWD